MADPNKLGPTHEIHFDLQGNPVDYARQSLLHKIAINIMNDPGISPMPLGVVAAGKGGQLLADQLASEADYTSLQALARKYMQLKYPKLFNKVDKVLLTHRMESGLKGMYEPYSNRIYVNTEQTPLETVNTIGHELTHGAIQQTRTPQLLGPSYIEGDPLLANGGPAYYNQPAEVNARQGGATANSTFLKFLDTYPVLQKLFGGQ